MKYSRAVLVMLILLCASPTSAASLRDTLGVLYRQRDAAASRRDPVGCMAVCTSDFAYFVGGGPPQNFARAKNRMAHGYSAMRRAHVTTTLLTLTASIDGITVLAQEKTQAALADNSSLSGPPLIVTRNVRDFWARTNTGTWKLKRRRLLQTSATVNGLPVRTNLPPPHPLLKSP